MSKSNIEICLHCEDLELLQELFGTEAPALQSSMTFDDHELAVKSIERRPGMVAEDVLITIVINVATGIPTGLLATWIWEKLSKKGARPVAIMDDADMNVTAKEIEEAINAKYHSS